MRYSKIFALATVAAGLALSSGTASAQDRWDGRDYRDDRAEVWRDARDLRYDYAAVERLRRDIANDRYRLNEAIRRGRQREAAAYADDLARDQRRLHFL